MALARGSLATAFCCEVLSMRQRSRLAKQRPNMGEAGESPLTKNRSHALMSAIRFAATEGNWVMAKKKKAKKAAKKTKKKAAKKAAKTTAKKTAKKAAKKTKKTKAKKSRRTVLYSSKGKKLYAVRDKGGKFKDIQTYKRAHGMDIKRKSKSEAQAEAGPAAAAAPAAS
ncbi:MAG TPA: hypothetical protein PL193_10425 [Xanthobacteraceae bacterium]|nr:hypothetical protein [Xanthobacteraceae bacterium]